LDCTTTAKSGGEDLADDTVELLGLEKAARCIGRRVRTRFNLHDGSGHDFFEGEIVGHDAERHVEGELSKQWCVLYDDGEERWEDIADVAVEFV
jgi:hypothetical protein